MSGVDDHMIDGPEEIMEAIEYLELQMTPHVDVHHTTGTVSIAYLLEQ
jgi:hypothetical protein